jgi:mono/diheme cytochrome c family protein
MRKSVVLIAIILGIFACNHEQNPGFLKTNNIRTQLFKIDPAKPNTIKGARGGIFKIPAGAFDGTEPVIIELKEIYSPIEILASGLTTESNGELLESGGMFYINAKRNGDEIKLKKSIEGSIPSENINPNMQLFKGEEKKDGNVNWIEPEPLKQDTAVPMNEKCIKAGQMLFWTNCASCHAVSKQLTGPALAGADKRITREMYYELVANPAKAARKYPYFAKQIKKYNMMTAFPGLIKEDVDCIIEFVKAAESNPSLEVMPDSIRQRPWPNTEPITKKPCGFDTTYITPQSELDTTLFTEQTISPQTIIPDTPSIREANELESLRGGFSDGIISDEGAYNFSITTLGWYNVDAYVKGLTGTSLIELVIDTDHQFESNLDIHVFMPRKKLLSVAQYHKDDGLFHFEKIDGKAPFFLNDEAIAIAITSKGGRAYYGITKFKVAEKQKVFIKVRETTPEEIKVAIQKNQLDGITLDFMIQEKVIREIPCNENPEKNTDTAKYSEMNPK